MTPEESEGFILRPPTLDDIPAVVAMLNASWLDTAGTHFFNEAATRTDWQEPGFDYSKHVRLAMDDDQLVGYIQVSCKAPYVRNHLFARTHPSQQGRGIGTALTTWGEGCVAENIALAPPSARVTVDCSVISTHDAGAALLLGLGYQHTRSSYEMKIDMKSVPPPPLWPAGIAVRSMKPNQEEDVVFRALDESFRDHWGHVERPLEEPFAAWLHFVRNNPEYDPDFFWLAMDGDEIAGFALCFPKDIEYPDTGWVNWLGVRRPWRRRGLATALLHHAFGECYQRGIQKVGLGVDASSLTGATQVYEKAGMHVFRQWNTYQKELRPGEDITTHQLAV